MGERRRLSTGSNAVIGFSRFGLRGVMSMGLLISLLCTVLGCRRSLKTYLDSDDVESAKKLIEADGRVVRENIDFLEGSLLTTARPIYHCGSAEMLEMLIDQGADPNDVTYDQEKSRRWSVLGWHAATSRDDSIGCRLLALGADPNGMSFDNQPSPLMLASANNREVLVACLIEHGADINYVDERDGATPLHRAAHRANLATIELLVNSGADTTVTDASGLTPLDVYRRQSSLSVRPQNNIDHHRRILELLKNGESGE